MKAQKQTPRPMLVGETEPEIAWRHDPRIEPGEYRATCAWAKIYRDPGFKRWTCLLRFEIRSNDLFTVIARSIPMWLNLGSQGKPHASRRTRYFTEWIRANDGKPPERGDRISPKVFTHRVARVEIGDTNGHTPYSVVKRIISWETGATHGHLVNKSHSQERHPVRAVQRKG